MTESNEKKDKGSRANILMAIGFGMVAILAMLTTMYVMSGAKLPS